MQPDFPTSAWFQGCRLQMLVWIWSGGLAARSIKKASRSSLGAYRSGTTLARLRLGFALGLLCRAGFDPALEPYVSDGRTLMFPEPKVCLEI